MPLLRYHQVPYDELKREVAPHLGGAPEVAFVVCKIGGFQQERLPRKRKSIFKFSETSI